MALGDTSLVVDDIDFTKALTVSVAVTLGDYVISDIAEADFTSGMPKPRFSTDIRVSGNVIVRADQGTGITRGETDLAGVGESDTTGAVEKAADDADIAVLRKTAAAAAAAVAKGNFDTALALAANAADRGTKRETHILLSWSWLNQVEKSRRQWL